MLHPAAAHFAVSLPIISLVLGLAYLIKPSELMSKISTRFMLFAAIFMTVAFFTGKNDGSEVFMTLTGEGQMLLRAHKDFALYLLIGTILAAVIKMFGCFKQSFKVELLGVLLIAAVSAGVLYQGKMGGELTFTHGAHVQNHADGLECIDDPEDYLDEHEED